MSNPIAAISSSVADVALVDVSSGPMDILLFDDCLQAVLYLINNGRLGGVHSDGFGCAQHKAALDAVLQQVADTTAAIAQLEEDERNRMPMTSPELRPGAHDARTGESL